MRSDSSSILVITSTLHGRTRAINQYKHSVLDTSESCEANIRPVCVSVRGVRVFVITVSRMHTWQGRKQAQGRQASVESEQVVVSSRSDKVR